MAMTVLESLDFVVLIGVIISGAVAFGSVYALYDMVVSDGQNEEHVDLKTEIIILLMVVGVVVFFACMRLVSYLVLPL